MILHFGTVTVDVREGWTVTRLPDGSTVLADHSAQAGQQQTAEWLGYATATGMNREHDAAHSLLAHVLGLAYSPTLWDVAHDIQASDLHRIEEDAVLSLQRFAQAVGVDLIEAARRLGQRSL